MRSTGMNTQDIDLEYQIEAQWLALAPEEQNIHRTVFIEMLTMGYHRRYFSRIPVSMMIAERWFRQYLRSIFFDGITEENDVHAA
jgi:hypothetical protein